MVRVAHESHLLGVEWLLLIDLTRLNRDALWLHVDGATSALVAQGIVSLTRATL